MSVLGDDVLRVAAAALESLAGMPRAVAPRTALLARIAASPNKRPANLRRNAAALLAKLPPEIMVFTL